MFGFKDPRAHEIRIQEYKDTFKSRINPILQNHEPLVTLLTANVALEVFVCKEWKGINIPPVHIKFSKDLPPYFRCKKHVLVYF